MGKLCRSRAGWRDLRPDSELYDRLVDLVQPAYFCDSIDFVFVPALDKTHDANQHSTGVLTPGMKSLEGRGMSLLLPFYFLLVLMNLHAGGVGRVSRNGVHQCRG